MNPALGRKPLRTALSIKELLHTMFFPPPTLFLLTQSIGQHVKSLHRVLLWAHLSFRGGEYSELQYFLCVLFSPARLYIGKLS